MGRDTAAYRFLSTHRSYWQALLQPHWSHSIKRIRAHDVVLSIQDTAQLDVNDRQATGLRPMSYETQYDMYLHPTYAISTCGEQLGVLDTWMWGREPEADDGHRTGIKESLRWIEGYERVPEQGLQLPSVRQVYVADREANTIALLVRARQLQHAADYLILCQHDRALPEGGRLWQQLAQTPGLGQARFELSAGRGTRPTP